MDGESECSLSLLEDNQWVLVKSVDPEVFLDYMRQHQVLSEDDSQNIQNQFVNPTRRARMRCFLGILRTRGPDNIKIFFKLLGWEYPHVYREVFRQEPGLPPDTYRQDKKSRLSCNLNQLLTVGLNMTRLRNQKEDLAEQVNDMEAMLKHQKNEIEDLEREHQRLRQFERDNQQLKERLHTVTTNNEEIKEENRQFLHEIRTLTLELQKRRDQETQLQGQLDEMTQQIQEKSFELNRKSREESDLRAKFEKVRQASIRFQSRSQVKNNYPDLGNRVAKARQDELRQQVEILMDDMKNLEETNRGLCEQLQWMQSLLDDEKDERDQMHRRVCTLEHDKNTLESRQITSAQKIERYYNKIKELEDQKRKLEEERMHMQTKTWEMSLSSEKQFEQLHKMETRYDQLQQNYEQFRQEHRYCVPGEPFERQRPRLPDLNNRPDPPQRPLIHSPRASPQPGKQDPFKHFASFYATSVYSEGSSNLTDVPDGVPGSPAVLVNLNLVPKCELVERDHGSMKVHVSESMRAKNPSHDVSDLTGSDEDDVASTLSELSSVSSSTFDPVDPTDSGNGNTDSKFVTNTNVSGEFSTAGNFFIRLNVKEDGILEEQNMGVQEGDILYVVSKSMEQWKVTKVDKVTGKLQFDLQGTMPNLERLRRDSLTGQPVRRNPSCDSNSKSTLSRANAFKQRVDIKRQTSVVAAYSVVCPMKATRLLPVLLICPPSTVKSLMSCMETMSQEWANIIPDGLVESSSRLFAETPKHNVLPWEIRPKDPQRYDNNLHKFIIIVITMESPDALPTLRRLLGEPDLVMDYEQEMKLIRERLEMVQRAGLHWQTVTVVPGKDNREEFWREVQEKVSQVQHQVFWLETFLHTSPR
ncbi:uncharacterized protein [Littorina saxatilis]|uniref:CARD domain-containing protein n=1 Tax=Littorina saxatilis TaxID=31220 RepID=A0AAN9BUU8_9CAEN